MAKCVHSCERPAPLCFLSTRQYHNCGRNKLDPRRSSTQGAARRCVAPTNRHTSIAPTKKGHASVAPIYNGHTSLASSNTGRNTVPGSRATKHNLRTRFLQNFRQRLSLPIRSNSRARFSYGAKPATSRTTSRTNLTRVLSFCRRALAARISEQDDASQRLASATPWFYDSKQLYYLLNGA